MYDLSPEALKAQREAHARRRVRESYADRGPYLDGDRVVVPSPVPHEWFNRVLRAYGFRFEHYDAGSRWTRPTVHLYRGRRYSPQGWLDWARRHYARAWPNWTEKERDDE